MTILSILVKKKKKTSLVKIYNGKKIDSGNVSVKTFLTNRHVIVFVEEVFITREIRIEFRALSVLLLHRGGVAHTLQISTKINRMCAGGIQTISLYTYRRVYKNVQLDVSVVKLFENYYTLSIK